MRVRKLVAEQKTQTEDTQWREDDIPPRHAPCYVKSRPVRAGFKWRSARAVTNDNKSEYVLLAQCNPRKDEWKSWLIQMTDKGGSVVGRFEFHGTHPGLHIHAHCGRSGVDTGPESIDGLARIPSGTSHHRRVDRTWTENGFWEASRKFFRIGDKKGALGI